MEYSVVIPTYNRANCIQRNLDCLLRQNPPPARIIIVDASTNEDTARLVEGVAGVLYFPNPSGRGNTPSSRNLGLRHAVGDVVAFLDDDAFVHADWAERMLTTFAKPEVSALAGRALNGVAGEETFGIDQIGQIDRNGVVKGFFAADPARVIEVDHGIGCNMAFRSSVIARLGGFRDDFRFGPFGICEETDIFVRAKLLGYRFFFDPQVCADHIAAPQPGGRRFSPKYSFYHSRNVLIMQIRNYGWSGISVRHLFVSAWHTLAAFLRKQAGAFAHLIAAFAGLLTGFVHGTWLLLTRGRDPIRQDGDHEEIRRSLQPRQEAKPATHARAA